MPAKPLSPVPGLGLATIDQVPFTPCSVSVCSLPLGASLAGS